MNRGGWGARGARREWPMKHALHNFGRENRRAPGRHWGRRAMISAAIGLATSQLIGCAQKAPPTPQESHPLGEFGKAVVLSAHPKQDAAAYQESQDQLSNADW